MKRKWIVAWLAVTVLATGLSACGNGTNENLKDSQTQQEEVKDTESVQDSNKDVEPTEEMEPSEQIDSEMTEKMELSEEEKMLEKYGIEIFCPKEYADKAAEVTYPEITKASYYSSTCEKERRVNILLPNGYTQEKKYPVVYLLHGIFGDENSMIGTNVAISNMMTKGLAEEAIVVYPYMYASKTADVCTAIDQTNTLAYDNFINDLVNDLMPFMAANYSVAEGKENTAIIGFSMGGRESLAIGLQRPDLFGYVGAIAPAPGLVPGKDWAMEHPGQFAEEDVVFGDEKPFLLMVCCGDKDQTVGQFPKSYHELFDKNGVEHIWWEVPGSDHGDPAITSGVYNFMKNIFKKEV